MLGKALCRRQAGAWQAGRKSARKGIEKERRRGNTAAEALPAPRFARDPLPCFGGAAEPCRQQRGRAGYGAQRRPRAPLAVLCAVGKRGRTLPGTFGPGMGKSEPLHGIM